VDWKKSRSGISRIRVQKKLLLKEGKKRGKRTEQLKGSEKKKKGKRRGKKGLKRAEKVRQRALMKLEH